MRIKFHNQFNEFERECHSLNEAIDFIVNSKFPDEPGVIERLENKMIIISELVELVIDTDPTIQSRILNEIIGSYYKVTVIP